MTARLPLITSKEGLSPRQQDVFDWVVESRGSLIRPYQVLLHSPGLARGAGVDEDTIAHLEGGAGILSGRDELIVGFVRELCADSDVSDDRLIGRRRVASVAAVTLGLLALGLLVGACSSDPKPVAVVDGVAIEEARFQELHVDTGELDDDERTGSVLLLILRQAFTSRAATELGVEASDDEITTAMATLMERIEARGDRAEVLATRNETEARSLVNAELDALRDRVGAHLVRSESDRFDLEAAELAFQLANAEVCVRHIQLADPSEVDAVLARLAAGQDFETVAREQSVDPFVNRTEGVGAGGSLGCSAPGALPPGLDTAALDTPLGRPSGPVTSSVGVHVIVVDERTTPDLDERHQEIVEAAVPVQGPEAFRQWAVDVLLSIEVTVDPSYGRWGILPETVPVPTVVGPDRFGDIIEQ